jgi:NAD(P)-dependent dehydrogenase (short-subunit alcohol dehydrogenase family)
LDSLADFFVKEYKVNVSYFECDFENTSSRKSLFDSVSNQFEKLNILINNAAITGDALKEGWSVPFLEQSINSWNRAMQVNLNSCFEICQHFYPMMKNSYGANIINIASIYGSYGPDWSLYKGTKMGNPAGYGVSKAGLIQLTRWLSKTLGPEIRVNSISPGGILRNQDQEFQKRYLSRTPLERMAVESDFRGPITLLATELGKYITGQNLIVDGGWGV